MSRSPFGWSYPPGCSGPPEDRIRQCKCGKSEEDHDVDEHDNLEGCAESGCLQFEERVDEPVEDYDQMGKELDAEE